MVCGCRVALCCAPAGGYCGFMTVIARSSDVMGGTAAFCGTRVPVQTLLDYLEAGETIDDFLQGFPSVTRTKVHHVSGRRRRTEPIGSINRLRILLDEC